MYISGPITNVTIQLDADSNINLMNHQRLELIIDGTTTGAPASSVVWKRNGNIIDKNTQVANGYFYDGGGETIVGTGPCESHMYRVALAVKGYLPGNYTYTVINDNMSSPLTSPVFIVEGRIHRAIICDINIFYSVILGLIIIIANLLVLRANNYVKIKLKLTFQLLNEGFWQ